jgi:hypothetical protein
MIRITINPLISFTIIITPINDPNATEKLIVIAWEERRFRNRRHLYKVKIKNDLNNKKRRILHNSILFVFIP